MGGGKTTTTTTVTQTAEEKEYTKQQIELSKQQLKLIEEQHGWQSEIYTLTKPLLEKYALMVDQEFAIINSPEYVSLRAKQNQLDSAQVDSALRQLPIQEELQQLQLDEIRRGGRATPEQKILIDQIAQRALESGESDIGRFMSTGLDQVRRELAPSRGMRPDDAPVVDAGRRVLEEGIRQQGGLVSDIRGAQANAELNFPLNASQITGGFNQWQQGFNQNANQFLSGLNQQAGANRTQLMGQLFSAPMAAFEGGLGLVSASRPNAVDFPRNTTTTQKTSGGSPLGAIGGLLSGLGSLGGAGGIGALFSTKKAKTNIKPIEAPPGHLLSPGALKRNIVPMQPQGGPAVTNQISDKKFFDFSLPASTSPTNTGKTYADATTKQWQPPGPPLDQPTGLPRTDEDILDRISKTAVSSWQYKPETGLPPTTHFGPMAEDFNTQVMGKQPEPFINTVDAIGSLMSSVKALDRRTKKKQPAFAGGSPWPRG